MALGFTDKGAMALRSSVKKLKTQNDFGSSGKIKMAILTTLRLTPHLFMDSNVSQFNVLLALASRSPHVCILALSFTV